MKKLSAIKKAALFFLIVSICAAPFALWSCAKETETTQSEKGTGESDATEASSEAEYVPDLVEADYGGYTFTIISRDDAWHTYPLHSRDIIAEEGVEDAINDAVFKRNAQVCEMYNIEIKLIALPETTGEGEAGPNNALAKAVKANDDIYDLVMTHEINGGGSAALGYFYNWRDIPNIDLSRPWWCQGAVEGLSVNHNLFLCLSDMSVSSNDHCYTVLFNKAIQSDNNIENLYELVRQNKWTFDKMSAIMKGISKDLDGNGKMDADDLYGLIAGGGQLNFFNAGENWVTKKDADDRPYIDILTERSTRTFEKAYDIINSPDTYSFTSWIDEKIVPMFAANHSFLLTTQVGIIQQLRSMEVDFGVLPYPKLDEAQEGFYNYVDGHAQLMGVPSVAGNVERTGAIIEALSYYSYKYLVPAYYDVNLKTKHSRDDESAEMLDHIFAGRVFDFGYVYSGWSLAFTFGDLINTKKNTWTSTIEKGLKAGEKNLEKVLKAFDNISQ